MGHPIPGSALITITTRFPGPTNLYPMTRNQLIIIILAAVVSGLILAAFSPLPMAGLIFFFLVILPLSLFSPLAGLLVFLLVLITDHTIQIATIDFWLAEFISIPILFFWIIRMILKKQPIPKTTVTWPLILFLLVTLANVAYSTDVTEGLGIFRKELSAILIFFFIINLNLSIRKIYWITNTLVFACIISCLVGILQNLTGEFGFSGEITQRGYLSLIFSRQLSWVRNANGFFHHFNSFGSLASQIFPISFSLALYAPRDKKRLHLVALIIIAIGLLLSYSRGAFLAAVVASFFVWYPNMKSRVRDKLFFFVLFGNMVYIASVIFWKTEYLSITNRLAPRMRIWGIVLENIRQHFWAGTGLASMMDVITASIRSGPIIASHNNYLTLLLERGILGLSIFLWIVILFFRQVSSIGKMSKLAGLKLVRALNIGIMGSMIVFLVHSAFDHLYGGFTFKVLFFLYIALIVSLRRSCEKQSLPYQKPTSG